MLGIYVWSTFSSAHIVLRLQNLGFLSQVPTFSSGSPWHEGLNNARSRSP